jgi:ParB-like chromosome segregation protein Spo0J
MQLGPIRRVPIDALIEYPSNPRRGDVPAIAESLKQNGQYRPVVVQQSTNHVLAGNHLRKAAVSLGWTEIDTVYIDVDDLTAKRIVLADNRLSDIAGYSSDDLAALLSSVDDLRGTGYTSDDLARLCPDLPTGFTELDPDALPADPPTVTCPSCQHVFTP